MDFMKALGLLGRSLQKNAPKIEMIGGIAMMGVGVGIAIKKAYSDDTLHDVIDNDTWVLNNENAERSDKIEAVKEIAVTSAKTFWLPTVLYIGGQALQIHAFGTLDRRNGMLMLVNAGLAASLTKLEANIRSEYGDEAFEKLYFGERKTTDGENSKPEFTAADCKAMNFLFSKDTSKSWTGNPNVDVFYLIQGLKRGEDHLRRWGGVSRQWLLEHFDAYEAKEWFPFNREYGWCDGNGTAPLATIDYDIRIYDVGDYNNVYTLKELNAGLVDTRDMQYDIVVYFKDIAPLFDERALKLK